MGLSSSKTKQTNAPSTYAKPYIDAAGSALGSSFAEVQPRASAIGSAIYDQLPGLQAKAFGADPGITAATSYNTDVLGGKYLDAGNPYLAGIANDTASDVTNRISTQFGAAGRTGSQGNVLALTKGLASARNSLYGAEYDAERGRMSSAAALAPSLGAAQYQGLGAYLQAAAAATGIPQSTASAYASGLGSLFSPYNTSTQTTSPGLGLILAQAAGNVAASYAGRG